MLMVVKANSDGKYKTCPYIVAALLDPSASAAGPYLEL